MKKRTRIVRNPEPLGGETRTELRWERCRDSRYAGYDGDDFVALLKPIVFERDGRNSLTGVRVYEDAWTWELYDTEMNLLQWGDTLTCVKAKEAAEDAYDARKQGTQWKEDKS